MVFNISVFYEDVGYILVFLKSEIVKGFIVFFNFDWDMINKIFYYVILLGIVVVYVIIGNWFEFFFEEECM